MANIKIFDNPQFGEVRTAGTSDKPFFCLADICRVLDLRVDNTLKRLKEDGYYQIGVTDSLGREQMTYFINEQNMYRVIMRSDKPQAEKFQDWVCGEVLPTIRKTGKYEVIIGDSKKIELSEKMAWISFTKEILHLNESSVLILMRQVAEPLGLPLPDYVDSKGTLKSATELIKQFNVGIKIQAFNALMWPRACWRSRPASRTRATRNSRPSRSLASRGARTR